jgi:hypothetical protein
MYRNLNNVFPELFHVPFRILCCLPVFFLYSSLPHLLSLLFESSSLLSHPITSLFSILFPSFFCRLLILFPSLFPSSSCPLPIIFTSYSFPSLSLFVFPSSSDPLLVLISSTYCLLPIRFPLRFSSHILSILFPSHSRPYPLLQLRLYPPSLAVLPCLIIPF